MIISDEIAMRNQWAIDCVLYEVMKIVSVNVKFHAGLRAQKKFSTVLEMYITCY